MNEAKKTKDVSGSIRHWLERLPKLRQPLLLTILLGSILLAIYVSTSYSLKAFVASAHFLIDLDTTSLLNSEGSALNQKRLIQKHFLRYGIYIPIDDVIFTQKGLHESQHLKFLQSSCGQASLYIWVPLKFRLPLIGEKVSEWCLATN